MAPRGHGCVGYAEAVRDRATANGTDMGNPRTDRLGLLVDQLDSARELAQARLEGLASPASLREGTPLGARRGSGRLSDEEYLWEPAPGAWSIRRRDQASTPRAFGPGEWVLDRGAPEPEPDPAPVTTTAWRLGHLHSSFAGRWEWTFGQRRQQPELLVDFTPSAAVALERFWGPMDRWRDSVAAMTPEQLDTPGFGQYPKGSDPEVPFITVVWWTNLEFIHHMAEIALLRDLWRARSISPQ
jgi:DinB superfamily